MHIVSFTFFEKCIETSHLRKFVVVNSYIPHYSLLQDNNYLMQQAKTVQRDKVTRKES